MMTLVGSAESVVMYFEVLPQYLLKGPEKITSFKRFGPRAENRTWDIPNAKNNDET
jgi:hypothetical protein